MPDAKKKVSLALQSRASRTLKSIHSCFMAVTSLTFIRTYYMASQLFNKTYFTACLLIEFAGYMIALKFHLNEKRNEWLENKKSLFPLTFLLKKSYTHGLSAYDSVIIINLEAWHDYNYICWLVANQNTRVLGSKLYCTVFNL